MRQTLTAMISGWVLPDWRWHPERRQTSAASISKTRWPSTWRSRAWMDDFRSEIQISNSKSASPRGVRQTAYQILVASSEKLLAEDRGDLWDSGKVESGKSDCIEYAGQALSPATRYCGKYGFGPGGRVPAVSARRRGLIPALGQMTGAQVHLGRDRQPEQLCLFRKAFTVTGSRVWQKYM